ncbi:MAG: sporulation protein [Oscillospiraceae bacterium]|nr:sporulation protein [Oscillospiraceae bacterium]
MEERGRRLLHRAVEVSDKLDLPAVLAPNLPRMELMGTYSFYMDRHRGVLGYSTEAVDINGGSVIVRLTGNNLQLQAMTDEELRITGHIEKVELVE